MSIIFNNILLDAARLEVFIHVAKEINSFNSCLYKGTKDNDLEDIAPYLFTFQENIAFTDWYFKVGWGQSWGILLFSSYPFDQVYNHFRKFLMVKTEDDEQLYFRFYDPRVLRIFLPTCDEKQLKEFFGPIEQFICEDEDPAFALVFSFEKNTLKTQRITKESLFESGEQKNQGRKFFV